MKYRIISILIISFSNTVFADLPLSLEDVLTNKGQWKLETSFNYINSENTKSEFLSPLYIHTANGSFIPVPTELVDKNQNSDLIVANLGLRYGLNGNTDLYGNSSYLWKEERSFINDEKNKTRTNKFSDLSIGISHTFLKDENNPALIGFLEGNIYEKSQKKHSSFKSWLVGITTYRAIDPIILSLTTSYRMNLKKNTHDNTIKDGNYFMVNPSVSFAANDRVTLTTGMQWLLKQADKINGYKQGVTQTSTHLYLGTGFSLTNKISANISTRFNISGKSSSEIRLGLQYSF